MTMYRVNIPWYPWSADMAPLVKSLANESPLEVFIHVSKDLLSRLFSEEDND